MKHLLLALAFFSLVGCEDSATNEGYDAGYNLTCGFSWSAGNRLVVDKEFAYHFLAGARECAQAHPESARKVLGLATEERAVSARKAYKPAESVAEEQRTQQEAPTPFQPQTGIVEVPAKVKAPAKTRPPVKAKAPVKTKAPAKTKARAKTKAPVQAKTPAAAKPPAKSTAPAKAAKDPAVVDRTSISRRKDQARPVTVKPTEPRPRKKTTGGYESFMGQ